MAYRQEIEYIDYIKEGVKEKNAGFVKYVLDGDLQKVRVWVDTKQPYVNGTFPVWMIPEKSLDHPVLLGNLELHDGKGELEEKRALGDSLENVTLKMYLGDGQALVSGLQEFSLALAGTDHGIPMEERLAERPEIAQEIAEAERMTERTEKAREIAEAEGMTERPEIAQEIAEAEGRIESPEKIREMMGEEMQAEKSEIKQEAFTAEPISDSFPVHTEEESKVHVAQVMEKKQKNRQEYAMEQNKWEQLWKIFPHIRPFEDGREYLSILPGDLILLRREDYGLCKNSFLLHGYTNYGYLIMGKMGSRGDTRYYVGVPGKYYEKECEAALYFGFESFEGKKEPPKEGDFGYYMKRVVI